jgi:predicted ATPase/class 3 adenylate cyclase
VTFLFTDLEGSTRRWEAEPAAMKSALSRHDEILRSAIEAHDGHVVKTTGDGVLAAFSSAPQAALAAVDAQRSLTERTWETAEPLRVRMGLHTGDVELVDGDYHGPPLNRAARLMSVARGGQVLLSHATITLSRDALPDDIEIVDLGEHRLRDLARPERVFQLAGAGLSTEIGGLRTLDVFPGNLPRQATSFVGRDEEIARLVAALSDRRLVTVTGVGGVGKTRLAVQVAAELLPRFADGAWICELAAASDDDTAFAVVAATLSIKPRAGVALDDAIVESLRDKEMLVLLDNCEHLLSAAGSLAEALLRRCPSVSLLATSREGLGVDGEQVWPLRSLAVPREVADITTVSNSHAVQLFVDRATAARPTFTLNDMNVANVVEICRRLDGMPLALELAAARVTAMSPAEIARLLDERFRLLTGGRRTAVERHQTLRATVDWSYSLLDAAERAVFDRLSVFAGSFDAESAAAVVSGDGVEEWDARDALMALIAKSLVVVESIDEDITRYQLLETLRQYGREQLDGAGTTDQWRRRHAQHFAAFAERAGPELQGPDELPWRRRVGYELDNLRAAVTWSLDSPDDEDSQLSVCIIAALAYEGTLRRAGGLAGWAEKAIDRARRPDTSPGRRAAVLGAAGFGFSMRGDFDTARALAVEAVREEISNGSAPNMAIVLSCQMRVVAGDAPGAVDEALRYAALYDERGIDIFHICNLRTIAAIWALHADDLETARREMAVALALGEETGNPSSMVIVSSVLGWVLTDEDPDVSLEHLERSVALTRAGASDVMLSVTLAFIAVHRVRRGEHRAAVDALREAVQHVVADSDLPGCAGVLNSAVTVLANLGQHEAAVAVSGSLEAGALAPVLMVAPVEALARARAVDAARDALGDARYDAARSLGAAMSTEEIVKHALRTLDDVSNEL